MEWLPALLGLTLMEIVLGIDNLVFVSIVSNKLPEKDARKAQFIGLTLAIIMRIALLFLITVLVGLTFPVFGIDLWGLSWHPSWRDLILLGGGLFLLAKSTTEIHAKFEAHEAKKRGPGKKALGKVIIQIILLDLVFSFDSILTAVGLAKELWVMVVAVVISMGVMMLSMRKISGFIERHPTVKMLALAFLLLIGFMLVLEGFHIEIPKGYIYFAMFFSLFVEFLNMRLRGRKATAE